jgi:hypothetical protein
MWADAFMDEIIQIVAKLQQANPDMVMVPRDAEDRKRNSDLMILGINATRIACRVRKPEYAEKYADEFTIRFRLPWGGGTEYQKIMDGWGQFFFYGFADAQEKTLQKWVYCDLNVLRDYFIKNPVNTKEILRNKDNSSHFLAIRWREIPGLALASFGH